MAQPLLSRLRLDLDYSQERTKIDAQTVLAQGSYPGRNGRVTGWDFTLSSADVWQDPVTWTLFLRPNVKKEAWNTSGVGDYARYRKAQFTFTTPAGWVEEVGSEANTGDYWLAIDGLTADESVITTAAVGDINAPVYFAWFGGNANQQRYKVWEAGWNDVASSATGVSLIYWSDDVIEVYKDGVFKSSYKLGGEKAQAAAQQSFQSVMLLPCRKRELLVVSGDNTGFSHVFDDLNEDDDEPVVTAASKFWIKVPVQAGTTRSFKFQFARIKTSTEAYVVSRSLSFATAPVAAMEHDSALVYADKYGGTLLDPLGTQVRYLVDDNGSTPFVANGVRVACRIKATLQHPTGLKMFGLYGVLDGFNSLIENTAEGTFDLVPYVYECGLRVCEAADSTTIPVSLGRVDEMETAWLESRGGDATSGEMGLKTQANRPVKAYFGDQETGWLLMGGRSQNPKVELGIDDSLTTISFDIRDRWAALEKYVFRDIVPLDGILFHDALKFVVGRVLGSDPSRYDVEETTLRIPKGSSQAAGEWGFLIRAGDRASQVVERLIDTFACDWFYSFVPLVDHTVFRARSVDTLDSEPAVEIFLTSEEAQVQLEDEGYANRVAAKLTPYRVCHEYRQETLPVEATEIRVTGQDGRTGLPIQAFKSLPDLEDPTLGPGTGNAEDGLRPEGWRGEKEVAGLVDGAINTQSVLLKVAAKFANRVQVPRTLGEWACGLLFRPDGAIVFKGDVVRIKGIGDFRVTSIEASFIKEPDELLAEDDKFYEWSHRPAVYTGELIKPDQDGWRARTRGAGISQIADQQRRRNLIGPRAVPGFEFLLNFAPFAIVEVP